MEPWEDSYCGRKEASARRSGLRKAVRTEDTGHVSKLCVKTLFTFANFYSFLCIVRNCIILHSQDVTLGHFGKAGVYAGHCFIACPREVDVVD